MDKDFIHSKFRIFICYSSLNNNNNNNNNTNNVKQVMYR